MWMDAGWTSKQSAEGNSEGEMYPVAIACIILGHNFC